MDYTARIYYQTLFQMMLEMAYPSHYKESVASPACHLCEGNQALGAWSCFISQNPESTAKPHLNDYYKYTFTTQSLHNANKLDSQEWSHLEM